MQRLWLLEAQPWLKGGGRRVQVGGSHALLSLSIIFVVFVMALTFRSRRSIIINQWQVGGTKYLKRVFLLLFDNNAVKRTTF